MDETSRQLLGETHAALPVAPTQPARQDYEYQRAWHGQLVHALRAAGWVAARAGDGPPHTAKLGASGQHLLDGHYAATET